MSDELLLRTLAAVPVAALVPLGLPRLTRPRQMLLAAGIAALALGGSLGQSQAWVVLACTVAAAAVPGHPSRPWARLGAATVALVAAAAIVDAPAARDGIDAVADDWRVAVVLLGALACVFVGGTVISAILHPFALRVGGRSGVAGMEDAGRVIGWIERTLLYGLVLVGAPDAAALVIAGKSIARFPSFREEQFAEYYLIGSLLSLTVAIGSAVAVRAVIGLDPVAPL